MSATIHTLKHNDEEHSLVDWAVRTGIPYSVLYSRLRLGWEPSRILTTPPQTPKRIKVDGQALTVSQLSTRTGLRRTTLYSRLRQGLSGEKLIDQRAAKRHNPLAGSIAFRRWLFDFLVQYKTTNDGIAPSLQEIHRACQSQPDLVGISVSSIKWALGELRRQGLIEYTPNQPRCIKIVNGSWQLNGPIQTEA